jgi:glutamate synthase domain-containing protein 2
MIEIKISQGAKPGYGAILPGKKVTPEIARIRDLEPYKTVISPPGHETFSNPIELMQFVARLRELSKGKPIGFKMCLGQPHEFLSICKAIKHTGIYPDFITIDGGEGGTGAAHFESMHWVGMPLQDALVYVVDALIGFDLKKEIKVFAAGKVTSAFHVARLLALGADACYSARSMMFALGCVQALQCNLDTCPTGVTAMSPNLVRGLVPEDKKEKVLNYHRNTIVGVKEMLECAGMKDLEDLSRRHICRRSSHHSISRLDQVFPYPEPGCLLGKPIPEEWQRDMELADTFNFHQKSTD